MALNGNNSGAADRKPVFFVGSDVQFDQRSAVALSNLESNGTGVMNGGMNGMPTMNNGRGPAGSSWSRGGDASRNAENAATMASTRNAAAGQPGFQAGSSTP